MHLSLPFPPELLKIIEEDAADTPVLLPHRDVEVVVGPLLETGVSLANITAHRWCPKRKRGAEGGGEEEREGNEGCVRERNTHAAK